MTVSEDALFRWLADHPHYFYAGISSAELVTMYSACLALARRGIPASIHRLYEVEAEYLTPDYHQHVVRRVKIEPWTDERIEQWCFRVYQLHIRRLDELNRINSDKADANKKYFVTIGFNHQTWDIPNCCVLIQRVLDAQWVEDGQAVFELFRTNGEHPHAHLILKLENPLPKSKVAEKIFKLKSMKKFVLKKSFIDVKPLLDVHYQYVTGNKQAAKMPCIEKDVKWRDENKIPHMFYPKRLLE